METIKIAHLYYDLLNLYGESGNVKALIRHLEHNKVKVITHFLTVDDAIDFDKYDIFYLGSGNEENLEIVRNDLLKRKKDIESAWKKKKYFFVTGNALNLFGKEYIDLNGNKKETLGLLKFSSKETDFRIVGETEATFSDLKEEIIGFENRSSVMVDVEEPNAFLCIQGTGYVPKETKEGIKKSHFLGTYQLGPLFIRNPHLTEYYIKKILEEKKIPYEGFTDNFGIKAYNEYKKNILNIKK